MMKRIFLVILLLDVYLCGAVSAETFFVDADSPNDPGTGSASDPFRKIQDAIDEADDGDTIEVKPGTYTGTGNYAIDPNGKSITIRSTNPNEPNITKGTVIDPSGSGRIFIFQNNEDANCIIAGLTLTGGYTDGLGGAIYCNNSSPSIKRCIITDNNGVWGGGGIYCYQADPNIVNCLITANTTSASGGAIKCTAGSKPILQNCTISANYANWQGDGIYFYDSNAVVRNCIIWANGQEEIRVDDCTPSINYSDIRNGWSGTGNLNQDPCFVSFDPNGNPMGWDFHLQSVYGRWDVNSSSWVSDSNTSPCIDAGDPNSDWNGEPWANGKRINMGVFGGTEQASKNGNPADFDIDGSVNFNDYASFSGKWRYQQQCIEDLTLDAIVDYNDLAVFTENWLWQK